MTPRLPLTLLLLVAPLAAQAGLFDAENRIELPALRTQWDGLLGRLAATDWVRAPFTEKRYFSVRRMPVVLKGDLIVSREQGLSLHYDSAAITGWSCVIVDQAGLLLRDEHGKELIPPGDPRVANAQRILLNVLQLDLPPLAEAFEFRATGTAGDWQIGLLPRTADARRAATSVTLAGAGVNLQRIVLERTATQRVEIEIGTPEIGRAAVAAELQARFRHPTAEVKP